MEKKPKPADVCATCGTTYSEHYTPYDFAVPNCPALVDGRIKYVYKNHFTKKLK